MPLPLRYNYYRFYIKYQPSFETIIIDLSLLCLHEIMSYYRIIFEYLQYIPDLIIYFRPHLFRLNTVRQKCSIKVVMSMDT